MSGSLYRGFQYCAFDFCCELILFPTQWVDITCLSTFAPPNYCQALNWHSNIAAFKAVIDSNEQYAAAAPDT